MKASLAVLAVTLILVSAGRAAQNSSDGENHSDCLSKEDVTWYMNRSKSGIPRTCTDSILQQNLNRLNGK